MGPVGIASQIRPISLRRIGPVRAKPGNRFAPRGDNCPHPFGKRIVGIGTQEIFIPLHGVAFERCGIGILHTDIAHRPVANRGGLILRRLRGRIRCTIEKHELGVDLLCVPGHLRALARFIDAEPHAAENLRQRQPAGADHLCERLRVSAIWPLLIGSDRARRGVERDQHVPIRLNQREATRKRLAALDERLLPGRVQHDDAGLQRKRCKLADVITDPHSFSWNVGVATDRRIDGYEIVLTRQLHSIAGEIHHRDRVRT